MIKEEKEGKKVKQSRLKEPAPSLVITIAMWSQAAQAWQACSISWYPHDYVELGRSGSVALFPVHLLPGYLCARSMVAYHGVRACCPAQCLAYSSALCIYNHVC